MKTIIVTLLVFLVGCKNINNQKLIEQKKAEFWANVKVTNEMYAKFYSVMPTMDSMLYYAHKHDSCANVSIRLRDTIEYLMNK